MPRQHSSSRSAKKESVTTLRPALAGEVTEREEPRLPAPRSLTDALLARLALSEPEQHFIRFSDWIGLVEFWTPGRITSRDAHSVDFLHHALRGREPFIVDTDRSFSLTYREARDDDYARKTVELLAGEIAVQMSIDLTCLVEADIRFSPGAPARDRLRLVRE